MTPDGRSYSELSTTSWGVTAGIRLRTENVTACAAMAADSAIENAAAIPMESKVSASVRQKVANP